MIRVLTLYQDAVGTPLTIVFDGNGAPAKLPPRPTPSEIEVLYSNAGQTADQVIERVAHRMKPFGEVLAVTDDHAERETVLSVGGMASSCITFIDTVQNTLHELERDIQRYNRRERIQFKKSK